MPRFPVLELTGKIIRGTGKELERTVKGGRRAGKPATCQIFDNAADEVAALKSPKE